jgi:Ca-activated chloride channel family protein
MFLRDPYWLLCLLLVPAVAAAFLRRRQFGSLRFPSLRHFARRQASLRLMLLPVLPCLRVAGVALLAFALARPQKGTEIHQDFSQGVAIMMALDVSGSMRGMDFELEEERVTRLDAVKSVFRSFVSGGDTLEGRPYDEIGIVAFGGFAVSRAPLTLDHTALTDMLGQIEIPEEITDERGRVLNREEFMTAIGDGLALAVARLKESIAKSKVVILLSDGRSNAGEVDPEAAARTAKEFGIKVYTIGIGHRGYAPMPVKDMFGRTALRPVQVDFDPETLKQVAAMTGGKYFHAENTEALRAIYGEIDRMEKTEIESRVFMRFNELFGRYLWIGLGLLLGEMVLAHTVLRRIP